MRISDWSSDVCSSDLLGLEQIDQRVVRQDFLGVFGGDQRADRALDRRGGHRVTAVGGLDRAGDEIFEFEQPARGAQIFVTGYAVERKRGGTGRSVATWSTGWSPGPLMTTQMHI